jgi:hypothetical protein
VRVNAFRRLQRKKGGGYDLQKLRSVSGAILTYFLLPPSPYCLFFLVLFSFSGAARTAEGGYLSKQDKSRSKKRL